jgi:hypothetical protein
MASQDAKKSFVVPPALCRGVPMLKISSKKIKQVIIRIQDGAIDWQNLKGTKSKPSPSALNFSSSETLTFILPSFVLLYATSSPAMAHMAPSSCATLRNHSVFACPPAHHCCPVQEQGLPLSH